MVQQSLEVIFLFQKVAKERDSLENDLHFSEPGSEATEMKKKRCFVLFCFVSLRYVTFFLFLFLFFFLNCFEKDFLKNQPRSTRMSERVRFLLPQGDIEQGRAEYRQVFSNTR